MAARCHHPNLIGATRQGHPKIITELMHTSLHKLMQTEALDPTKGRQTTAMHGCVQFWSLNTRAVH